MPANDGFTLTPLHWAVTSHKGNAPLCEFLLAKGCDVFAATWSQKRSALHIAASLGNADVCELLLRYGGPQLESLTDKIGRTAFILACGSAVISSIDAAKTIFKFAGERALDKKDDIKWSALHIASSAGNINTVKWLLSIGLTDTPDDEGLLAFDWACRKGYPEIANLLSKQKKVT